MRKTLVRGIRMQKFHKPGRKFLGFSRIFMELRRSKVEPAPLHGNFIMASLTSKLSIIMTSQISMYMSLIKEFRKRHMELIKSKES